MCVFKTMNINKYITHECTRLLWVSEYIIRTYGTLNNPLWHIHTHMIRQWTLFNILYHQFSFFFLLCVSRSFSCSVSAPGVIMDEMWKSGCIIQGMAIIFSPCHHTPQKPSQHCVYAQVDLAVLWGQICPQKVAKSVKTTHWGHLGSKNYSLIKWIIYYNI